MLLNIVYVFGIIWFGWSIGLIHRKKKLQDKFKHDYLYDAIPGVFVTLGVLGTFVGIAGGLDGFNVNDIEGSIPNLLEGLKNAFYTSIGGIILSIIFGRVADIVAGYVDKNTEEKQTADTKPEFDFNKLYELLSNLDKKLGSTTQDTVLQSVASAVSSLEGTLKEERKEQTDALVKVEQAISAINEALGIEKTKTAEIKAAIDKNTKALGALSKLDALSSLEDIKQSNKALKESAETISLQLESAQENLNKQFEGLSETLAENNTKALVEVMENATNSFNQQMKTIVERLVKENFQELNNSVQQLNQWQQEHKKQVETLTKKFEEASAGFSETAAASQQIVANAKDLVAEDSKLSKLVKELGRLLVEDSTLSKSIAVMKENIVSLKTVADKTSANTKALETTSTNFSSNSEQLKNTLKSWTKKEHAIEHSLDALLSRLRKLEDTAASDAFWGKLEEKLNRVLGVIAQASKTLNKELEDIDNTYYNRLDVTFKNLDELIRRIAAKNNY